ncbi:MAG TPA: cytochrome b, partial [Methylophaga sp.]|nr:cytochrome b [Methylophaga sp.]
RTRSIRYRGPYFRIALVVFVISFLALGYLGTQPATFLYTLMAQIFTVLYFAFFLLMPIYTKFDKDKPVPERVT